MSTKYVIFWDMQSVYEALGVETALKAAYPDSDILVIAGELTSVECSPGRVYVKKLTGDIDNTFEVVTPSDNLYYDEPDIVQLMDRLIDDWH